MANANSLTCITLTTTQNTATIRLICTSKKYEFITRYEDLRTWYNVSGIIQNFTIGKNEDPIKSMEIRINEEKIFDVCINGNQFYHFCLVDTRDELRFEFAGLKPMPTACSLSEELTHVILIKEKINNNNNTFLDGNITVRLLGKTIQHNYSNHALGYWQTAFEDQNSLFTINSEKVTRVAIRVSNSENIYSIAILINMKYKYIFEFDNSRTVSKVFELKTKTPTIIDQTSLSSIWLEQEIIEIYELTNGTKITDENDKKRILEYIKDALIKQTGSNKDTIMRRSAAKIYGEIYDEKNPRPEIIQKSSIETITDIININKNNLSEYQINILKHIDGFISTLSDYINKSELSKIKESYDMLKSRINDTFSKTYRYLIIRILTKAFYENMQKKNYDITTYPKYADFLKELSIDMNIHPLLDELRKGGATRSYIISEKKAHRIILGLGTVEEKSNIMYKYMVKKVKKNYTNEFTDKSEFKKYYDKCVTKYGFN